MPCGRGSTNRIRKQGRAMRESAWSSSVVGVTTTDGGEKMRRVVGAVARVALAGLGVFGSATAQAQNCSVWLVESSRFMNVPFGAFMPDRAYVPGSNSPSNNINTVDLPVNVGVIKCGKELI